MLDERRDVGECDSSSQEGRYRDLVRRVESAGEGSRALAGVARKGEEREALRVGGLELERESGCDVERRDRGRLPVGGGEGKREGHAHVGGAEGCQGSAVAEAHDAVYDG